MNPDAETIPCCTGEFKEFEFENWDEKRQSEIQLYDLSKNDWIDECNRCRVSEIATGTSARYVESQLLHSVEDDDYNIELIEHQGEDSTQPEFQAGPSTPTVPTLDVDTEFQADPGPVLPTVHGLASVNESMVTSLSIFTS